MAGPKRVLTTDFGAYDLIDGLDSDISDGGDGSCFHA